MESNERDPVVLHNLPLLPESELKALIISTLPEHALSPNNILLRRKEDRQQAFLMLPSTQATALCGRKELQLGGEKVYVRRWYSDYQVFVGRLPEGVSLEEATSVIAAQFGKIRRFEEVLPHEGSKNKFRHLYLQFENQEDAEKCLFSPQKLIVKNYELRVARSYAFGENEETDKKLFIKVVSSPENSEDLETTISNYFRKEGQLREKVRLEGSKGTVTFTSAQTADRVLKTFKDNRIGNWDVILRPFANYKDNFTAFMANINPALNEVQLQQLLHEYEPIISCKLHSSSSRIINATVTFASETAFKRVLAEYKFNEQLKAAFAGTPYMTVHMSAKERNEYNNFRRGNEKKKAPLPQQRNFRPVMFPNQNEPFMIPQQQQPFGFGFPPQVGLPMNPTLGMPLPAAYRK